MVLIVPARRVPRQHRVRKTPRGPRARELYTPGAEPAKTEPVIERAGIRQCGKANQTPLRGRVGGPVRVAEAPGHRVHGDDRGGVGLLEQRDGLLGDVEGAGQVHPEHAVPGCRVEALHRRSWSGDASVVDEHIQATQVRPYVGDDRCDFVGMADVPDGSGDVGRTGDRGQGLLVDVGDVDPCALLNEALAMARPIPPAPAVMRTRCPDMAPTSRKGLGDRQIFRQAVGICFMISGWTSGLMGNCWKSAIYRSDGSRVVVAEGDPCLSSEFMYCTRIGGKHLGDHPERST